MTCFPRPVAGLRLLLPALALLATLTLACRPTAGTSSRYEASATAKRYPIQGIVRGLDKQERTVSLAHGPIEGLMDAMTMDFAVADAWVLDAAAVGDRISGTLVLDGARSWLDGVSISKADSLSGAATPTTPAMPTQEVVAPGTPLPDVALVDQDGRDVSPATYAGLPAVYTFIYTRCPLPDYCPLMMRRLNQISARLAAAGRRDDVWLMAVTLDPGFDRPPVLKAFGDRMIDAVSSAGRYHRAALLTGEPEAIRSFASPFQLTFEPAGDEIVHGLRTIVVDAEGRVVSTFRGSDWTVDAVLEALERARDGAAGPVTQ